MNVNNKVVYRVTHSIVKFYFKDGSTYSEDFADCQYGRYMYVYGELPSNKFEAYTDNVWENLLSKINYVNIKKTFFTQRIYLPPTDIYGIWIKKRIYKDELIKFTYNQTYEDCSNSLPSINILKSDLGFKDYSEYVFNREYELRNNKIQKLINIEDNNIAKEESIIKDCPFCGRKAELRHDKDRFSYIACTNKGCCSRTDECLNDNEAIRLWNKRIPLEKLKKDIQKDKEELLSTKNDCIVLSDNEVNDAQKYVYDRVINIIEEGICDEKM